jgi:ribosomal protein S18 acetylase RimI-like enzyme
MRGVEDHGLAEGHEMVLRMEGNLHAFLACLGSGPRGRVEALEGYTRVRSGIKDMNRIIRCRMEDAQVEACISKEVDFFGSVGEGFQFVLSRSSRPPSLAQRLLESDFRLSCDLPAMALDIATWIDGEPRKPRIPDGCALQRVSGEDGLADWMKVCECAYPFGGANREAAWSMLGALSENPDFAFYLVRASDAPVHAAALYANGNDAGLYWGATEAGYRGRGYAAACQTAMLSDLAERGMETAFLQASEASHGINLRTGFRDIGRMRIFEKKRPRQGPTA